MYKKSASYSEQAECVQSVANRCTQLSAAFNYSDQDARSVCLHNIRSFAYGCGLILNLLDSWAIGDKTIREAIPQLLGLEDVTKHSVQVAGNILHKDSKLTLVLLAQFQIENLFRNLARDLSIKVNQGFYVLAGDVLTHVGIPNGLDVLNTPALIRNSLHSNGIHRGYAGNDTKVTLGGVSYEFLNDEPVHCATVEHIAHSLESSLDVLDQVLNTSQVLALSDPLMDEYVWDIATSP